MASRHADRTRYDERAPRRDRDDRRDTRDRDDRRHYEDERSRNDRRRDRDRDRDRDSYRRSRSPRRDRDRDRSRDRAHGSSYRGSRDDRRSGHDDRWERHDRRDDHRRSDDRARHSLSATPGADPRSSSRANDIRQEKNKRADEKPKLDEDAKKAERLARVEAWKKKKAQAQTDSPAGGSSPAPATPATPTAPSAPSTSAAEQAPAKATAPSKLGAEKKPKQVKAKEPFKLAETAAPAPFAKINAAPSNGAAVSSRAGLASKPNGNIGSFGNKAKLEEEAAKPAKKAFLDDGESTGKRSLQALPDFTPLDQAPDAPDAEEDDVMDDMDSPEGDNAAEIQAQLEKRRAEMANEDAQMKEVTEEESAEKMDVDEVAGVQEDDIDPLDAFMAGLSETQPSRGRPQGQTMFDEDHEPDLTAVEGEDLLALAATKKRKKEVPITDHSKVEYEPFRKNFYTEPTEIANMTEEEVRNLRFELDGIIVKGANVPRPVTKWAQMGLLQQTMDVFGKLRFTKPTPIQAQAIPMAESGLDFIGVAKTGSGKTLAFGIPMIRHILDQQPLKPSDGPIALVLAPTRELSDQIGKELRPFLKASNLHIACAYGGSPISEQIAMIKRGGIHVLCATPGRLIDLLQSNSGRVLNLRRVTYLILDEADRMFDMGFEPQVMKIMANIRPDRQTILFSATMPKNINALAKKGLTNPAEVTIGGRSVVTKDVHQVVAIVPPGHDPKIKELLRQLGLLFSKDENAQILVFVERQETAEDLLHKLMKAKYVGVNTIHGAKDQTDRSEAINDFKQGVLPILIATSVAARGLDVPNLAMVFNYDCPTHLEDYVHRCGRTGRAGNKGTAITLVQIPGEERFAMHVARALRDSGQDVPEDLEKISKDFKAKIKAGEEKWFDPGFGGKGLDKLDAARAMEKRREKRAHHIEGEDISDDEPELPALKNLPEVVSATTAAGKDPEPAADEPAWKRLLTSKIVVNKTERPAATGPTKPMTAKERALAAASKVDGRLSKKGMIHHGQPIDNKGPDAGAFHSTIEINDFPQKARWAVTNRTNVVKILDTTGVSITTKGNFYPPGKEPGENDLPKLYILVEGDNENVVTDAMMEITRLLKEATMSADDAPRGATGRYSVV
ncbi:pre-mRNA processing RNA-helicase [Paraphaeosphaeria sporulosa]|uniref:RNA helicase n=1 Tax=Paraphaeosphaeria sporulosa TaxID=1460663 RepID=A0A177CZX4_9PLEO|nr:DEAD-domain-containing protein [Paraphaeosphaeria sporulosa]OAG12856.1 DEAD-domain-containing protein [Paraphaeosphaeria sporulosa]